MRRSPCVTLSVAFLALSVAFLALLSVRTSSASAQDETEEDSLLGEDATEQGEAEDEGWLGEAAEYDEEQEGVDDQREDDDQGAEEGEPGEEGAPTWFVGLHGRVNWVPAFLQEIVLADAIAVVAPGFNVVGTVRPSEGFSIVFGLGYVGYAFEGPFRAKNDDPEDTEYVDSNMGVVSATASLLWDIEVADQLAFEYGFGLDLAIITGSLVRTEAYLDADGEWQACRAVASPFVTTPRGELYCEPTQSGRSTDAYDADGAHYNVEDKSVPPVLPLPSIPHLALRYEPHEQVALKAELGYGVFQLWFGLSAHYGFK